MKHLIHVCTDGAVAVLDVVHDCMKVISTTAVELCDCLLHHRWVGESMWF